MKACESKTQNARKTLLESCFFVLAAGNRMRTLAHLHPILLAFVRI